jgi:hypothetical protein
MRSLAHAQNGQEGQSARKNLRHVRAAVQMAEEMGERLGRGSILLGSMPGEA